MNKKRRIEHDDVSLETEMKPPGVTPEMKVLPPGFQPGPEDAICSRGRASFDHNIHFREVIQQHLSRYAVASTKLEKSLIVTDVVEAIRRGSPNGGFVRKVDGKWLEVGDTIAREKIGGAFREMLHFKYSSSSKQKKRRREEEFDATLQSHAVMLAAGRNSAPPAVVGEGIPPGHAAAVPIYDGMESSEHKPRVPMGHFLQTGNVAPVSMRQELEAPDSKIHPTGLFGSLLQDINFRRQELASGSDARPPKLEEMRMQELVDDFDAGPHETRFPPPLAFPPAANWFELRSSSCESAASSHAHRRGSL